MKRCWFVTFLFVFGITIAASALGREPPALTGVDDMTLDYDTFSAIVDACTHGQYDSLARFYYGVHGFYPDIIRAYAVFVLDKRWEKCRKEKVVIEQNASDKGHILYGARAVYPWVFMLVPAKSLYGPPDSRYLTRNPHDSSLVELPEKVVVSQSQYAQQPDPGISVFSFLAGTFSKVEPKGLPGAAKAADRIDTLSFREIIPVNCENRPVKYRLFLARWKVNLESQTVNGLSIRLVNPSSSDAEWSVLYSKSAFVRFANYREYPFSVSLGLAFSRQEVNDTSKTEAQFEDWKLKSTDVELFLLLHWYPRPWCRPHWPRLPGRGPKFSLALSAGVKVDIDNFPQDLFLGVSLGDVSLGDYRVRHLQVSAGINFPVFELSDGKERAGELMFLLSIRLS